MLFDREAIEAGKHIKEHWKKITLGQEKSEGSRSCMYCRLYRNDWPKYFSCGRCPIFYFTKRDGCRNTPYEKYHKARRRSCSEDEILYARKMKILVDEIFIKSLLLFDIKGDYFKQGHTQIVNYNKTTKITVIAKNE